MDAEERRLWRDGEPIQLTPKQFDLLFYFIENAGRVAKKNELLDAVWADTYIEETTLARNVSWLRKTLAECAESEPFIETVPKLGYRFTAKVTRSVENALIIDEHTIQHIHGEEIITFDDEKLIKPESVDIAQKETTENNKLIPANKSLNARRFLSVYIPIFVSLALIIIVAALVLNRPQTLSNVKIPGLNVKATITVKNITVDATSKTVFTGLKVQSGDIIKVSAMGIHQPETGQIWTLEGDKKSEASANHTFPNAAPWSLVAWIGSETDNADYFQASKDHTIKVERSGSLYLAINDLKDNYADNRGGLNVAVVLYRTYSIYAEDNDVAAAWGNPLVEIHNEDTLAISGRGNVAYWPNGELYDLEGKEQYLPGCLAPDINTRSLIGKIGSRNPFKVGMNYPPQAIKANGELFLSVNDQIMNRPNSFKNNSGEITIDVEVVRQTEAFKNPI